MPNEIFSENPLNEQITLDTLVGEGRKYANADELAKAYANADSFILEAKRRETELQTEIDLLKAQKSTDGNPPEGPITLPVPNANPEVDISKLVKEEVGKIKEVETFSSNVDTAAKRLTDFYGSPAKANEAVRNRAAELNVSVDWLMDTAGRSPAAFLASMGVNETNRSANTPAPNSSVNLNTNTGGGKNWAYFEEIRKTNPKTYYSREVQNELFGLMKTNPNFINS